MDIIYISFLEAEVPRINPCSLCNFSLNRPLQLVRGGGLLIRIQHYSSFGVPLPEFRFISFYSLQQSIGLLHLTQIQGAWIPTSSPLHSGSRMLYLIICDNVWVSECNLLPPSPARYPIASGTSSTTPWRSSGHRGHVSNPNKTCW